MVQRHISRGCNYLDRLKETIDIARENDYTVVGIETKVIEEAYDVIRSMAQSNEQDRSKRIDADD